MQYKKSRKIVYLLVIAISYYTFGCAPKAYRVNPAFNQSCKNIKIYGIVEPDVEVCEITAGGVKEVIDEWCAVGRQNVFSGLETCLDRENVNHKYVTIEEDDRKQLKDIRALYKAVSLSIRLHTYGPYVFPQKINNFDYSVGPIKWILEKYECDALVLVYGSDEISTGGRKALMALGAIAGAFTGIVIMPRSGMTTLNVALIDESGNILWYNSRASEGGYDLRKPESALRLVESIISDFPECER